MKRTIADFLLGRGPTPLPSFQYHPDPLATGAIERSKEECACCHLRRGFIYVGPVYGEADLQNSLCPWCIADGSAARTLNVTFADDLPLQRANLPRHVVEEVHLRTPAFTSWQQEQWYAHCGDACAFHGDAAAGDVADASEATRLAWREEFGLTEEDWASATEGYRPGGPQAFYKFVCRHCGAVLLGWDFA